MRRFRKWLKVRLQCWLFGHRWVRVSMHRGVRGRWVFCADCNAWQRTRR